MVLAADAVDLARAQTAFSLAFHICFAVFGVGLPWMLIYTEWRWLRTGDPIWLALTKKWSRAFAVLFAVGAVSGTALSFEFGLLWPAFMSKYGGALGLSFTLEGFAFFTEAIFVGMYLYGWKRLSARAHWLTLWPIAISGTLSTLFIITVNAWMNVPRGIVERAGQVVEEKPLAPFTSPSFPPQVVHMLLAALMCAGGMVAAIYAVGMLRGRRDTYHQRGLGVGLAVVLACAPLQLVAGDLAGRSAGDHQPYKLAAMEGLYHTGSNAPFTLGGIYDDKTGEVRYGLEIPGMLSLLEGFSTKHVITGLDAAPPDERPDGTLVHGAFTVMIVAGSALIGLSLLTGVAVVRRRRRGETPLLPTGRGWLLAAACSGPAAMLAMLTGWEVTEGGRQPWIVGGHMRVVDAVTGGDAAAPMFAGTLVLYLSLAGALILILRRMATGGPSGEQFVTGRPTGPSAPDAPRPRDGGPGTRDSGPLQGDGDGTGADGSGGTDGDDDAGDDESGTRRSAPAAAYDDPAAVYDPAAEPAAWYTSHLEPVGDQDQPGVPVAVLRPGRRPASTSGTPTSTDPRDPATTRTRAGAPAPAGTPSRSAERAARAGHPAGANARSAQRRSPADRGASGTDVPAIPRPRSEPHQIGWSGLFGRRPTGRHSGHRQPGPGTGSGSSSGQPNSAQPNSGQPGGGQVGDRNTRGRHSGGRHAVSRHAITGRRPDAAAPGTRRTDRGDTR